MALDVRSDYGPGRCRFRSEADMQMVVQGNHIYADDPFRK